VLLYYENLQTSELNDNILSAEQEAKHMNKLRTGNRDRILIVDDDHDILVTFKAALEENNEFDVDTFTDPDEVLSNFKAGLYNLLIIDIRLPKMDGFELYDKIKEIDNKAKVCFVSAYEINYKALRTIFPSPDIDECFIRKPVNMKDFVGRVKSELTPE
jgi:DNA-binding response OmpR family regulator